jgi:predicted metal-dependent TIM-barrel fold hydrolase
MVYTLHRHKKEGTCRSMDIWEQDGLDPVRAAIDHNNEETVEETLTRDV